MFRKVFSDMDFLGWYSTGEYPTKVDADVHRQVRCKVRLTPAAGQNSKFVFFLLQILDIYESPLFLQMNPAAKNSDIPLTMYESLYDIVKGEAKMLFVKLSYSLATEEVSYEWLSDSCSVLS